MALRFLIKDRENKPYALVEILPDGAQFHPVVAAAKSWSEWMADEYAGKKISKEELTVTLDNSMSLETTVSDSMVEELKNRSLTKPSDDIEKKDASVELVPVISLMDVQLSEFPVEVWRNAIQYKAVAFIADQNKSSFVYEVKRTRAVWDPSLAIPGTERRGGFRCPVGTRYGGQITDRFGRQCGWGVARRLANEISDIGERLENVGDRRRERRVTRRNERMARRLTQGGAIERGARAVGDALDFTGVGGRQGGQRNRTGQVDTPKPGRLERAAGRLAEVVDPDKPNRNRRAPARNPRPAAPQRNPRRRPNLRDSEERRMEREIDNPGAPRTGPDAAPAPAPRPRPVAPRRPANPRPARPRNVPVDNTSKVPVPAGAPNARESLDAYKTRKYNEHQAEVRRIREGGGNAGFLRRSEWDRFHGPAVEQAWRDRNPDNPNAGRNRRTGASTANGRRPANRRPRPADVPEAVQPTVPPASRPARPRPIARRRPAGVSDDLWNEYSEYVANADLNNRSSLSYKRWEKVQRDLGRDINPPARPRPVAPVRPNEVPRDRDGGRELTPAERARVLPDEDPQRGNDGLTPAERGAHRAELEQVREQLKLAERMRLNNSEVRADRRRIAELEKLLGEDAEAGRLSPIAPRRPADPARQIDTPFGPVNKPNQGLHKNSPDRFNQKMGHKVVDGVLMPDNVAIGNAGITNPAEAKAFVANGGSLDDVPDMLVKDAILDNGAMPGESPVGKRFILNPIDKGINARGQRVLKDKTFEITDQVTGKRYYMKSPSWTDDEIVGEQYAAMMGQLAGRPMSRVRVISPRVERVNNDRAAARRKMNHGMLIEHLGDVLGTDLANGSDPPSSPDRASLKYTAFIDEILGFDDRHDGNYMWAGNEQLPIDHGIMERGDGMIVKISPTQADRVWQNVDSVEIKENFRRLSNQTIDNLVEAQTAHWRSIGLPSTKVSANRRNMEEQLRNLRDAAGR